MLGHSERELLGQKLWEDFPEARAILEQAKDLDLTQTLTMKADQVYELSVAPLMDLHDRKQGLVVVCRDVTERRRALSRLADSEHLIRTLIETSSNGILRFARDSNDPQHRFRCVFANRAAESYLSGDTGTLVGMPLQKLQQLERSLTFRTHATQKCRSVSRPGTSRRMSRVGCASSANRSAMISR
jgi:PAS domain-containing protein